MSTFEREKKIKDARSSKNSKLIRTAAYVRVSSDEQAKHGFSIEAQKKGLQKYAEERGYMIVEWYVDEGKTARKKTSKRKEYTRLIEDAKQGKFEMIIFKCLDRWFRNISEYYKAQSVLDEQDINWECSEEDYDTTTRDGRWKLHIYLMLAQDEADKTSERINYVFEHKIKNKEAITGNNAQPYGYVVKEIDGVKRVVIDENARDVIMDIVEHFELYNSKRAAMYYVLDKYGVELNYKTVTGILTNTYIYGHYRGVDDYIWGGSYITKERYNKIQKMLKKNVKERRTKLSYIFSGLLKCSHCGHNLTGHSYTYTMANGEDKLRYKFYRCNFAVMKKAECDARKTLSEFKIEDAIVASIEREIEDFICHYELEEKNSTYKPKVSAKEIKEEMDRLNKQWRKGRIQEEEYDYEFDRLEKRLKKIEEEVPKKRDLTPLYDFLNSDWKNVYGTLDVPQKRALWRSVIDYIELDLITKEFDIKFI